MDFNINSLFKYSHIIHLYVFTIIPHVFVLFLQVHWFGREGDFNVLVMDLLGHSIEELFTTCQRQFTLKTVLMLADQLIARISFVHNRSFIHRDIKPDNFMIGRGDNKNMVYIIDFGLAKKYRDPVSHVHIPYNELRTLTGTARYASVNAHLGIEQSRRDDLESLGFLLVYLAKGQLPWQGLRAFNKKDKYERISESKICTPVEQLCKSLPQEFVSYFHYCRSLRFDDKPDMLYLRRIFRDLFYRLNYTMDLQWDWVRSPLYRAVSPSDEPLGLEKANEAIIEDFNKPRRFDNGYEYQKPIRVRGLNDNEQYEGGEPSTTENTTTAVTTTTTNNNNSTTSTL